MLFDAKFIKTGSAFLREFSESAPAPMFRKKFYLKSTQKAKLYVCGLGFGYYYLNGEAVSGDLLTAPPSEYHKAVWYNVYDVSRLLKEGENVFAAILGNGFFNESFKSHWNNQDSVWRDNPKFAAQLIVDGEIIFSTDDSFVCNEKSPITYNHLRSGERFDVRLYEEDWNALSYDDSAWEKAVFDDESKFSPIRLECKCPPIVECEELNFQAVYKTPTGYTFDFGLNSSGYVRIKAAEKEGTELVISHAEEMNEDGTLKLNNLNILYPTVDFQVERIICGDKPFVYSPKFTYHGFRFVHIEGLTKIPEKEDLKAIFIHNDVKKISEFRCSNHLLNKIYDAGIRATYSNLHYVLTDCPTREKFGWMNDAQASAEQIYMNFDIQAFMDKWYTDIKISANERGEVPAIVPSHGYGLNHGPVADGALFEIPYRAYQYTGNPEMLINALPYLDKYMNFFLNPEIEKRWWLGDWDGYTNNVEDAEFINLFYRIKFYRILTLAHSLEGDPCEDLKKAEEETCQLIKTKYLDANGRCKIHSQAGAAMMIWVGADSKPLIKQMKDCIKEANGHLKCGMLGIQYIYDALSENGAAEWAYKIITAKGDPGFENWISRGATTLFETWRDNFTDSRNHHMYSNVLAWFFKALLGIQCKMEGAGFSRVDFKPCFIKDLDYCKGSLDTVKGKISVEWKKCDGQVCVEITIPDGVDGYFKGKKLKEGKNLLYLKQR